MSNHNLTRVLFTLSYYLFPVIRQDYEKPVRMKDILARAGT
jgi:hypothetical protein